MVYQQRSLQTGCYTEIMHNFHSNSTYLSSPQEITEFQVNGSEIIGITLILSSFTHNGTMIWLGHLTLNLYGT